MARSDASIAVLLLASRLLDSFAKSLSARELWQLDRELDGDVAQVLDPGRVQQLLSGTKTEVGERAQELVGGASAIAFELERLEQQGIRAVTFLDDGYPDRLRARLGDGAPPVLFAVGDLGIAGEDGLGIVGSRDAAQEAASAAQEAARLAVREGLAVVSGGARGIDRIAMNAAFEADGRVVGVLADSLERTVGDPSVRRAIAEDRLCLLTPYKPSAPFSVGNAMGRNKLIYALSDWTLVVQSDLESGGTWAGAVEALEGGFGRVAVWTAAGAGPGNAALVQRGGVGVGSPDELGSCLREPPTERAPLLPTGQLPLNL